MITELARKLFARRIAEIGRYAGNAEEIQRKQLEKLLQKARTTEFGRLHGFAGIHSAEEFAQHVPVCTYEQMHGYAERMARGEKNVLWPGRVVSCFGRQFPHHALPWRRGYGGDLPFLEPEKPDA